MNSMRGLLRWCVETKKLAYNPSEGLKMKKLREFKVMLRKLGGDSPEEEAANCTGLRRLPGYRVVVQHR